MTTTTPRPAAISIRRTPTSRRSPPASSSVRHVRRPGDELDPRRPVCHPLRQRSTCCEADMTTQDDQRPPAYDLVVVSDRVVLGERLVPAGIAVVGEKIAAIL